MPRDPRFMTLMASSKLMIFRPAVRRRGRIRRPSSPPPWPQSTACSIPPSPRPYTRRPARTQPCQTAAMLAISPLPQSADAPHVHPPPNARRPASPPPRPPSGPLPESAAALPCPCARLPARTASQATAAKRTVRTTVSLAVRVRRPVTLSGRRRQAHTVVALHDASGRRLCCTSRPWSIGAANCTRLSPRLPNPQRQDRSLKVNSLIVCLPTPYN